MIPNRLLTREILAKPMVSTISFLNQCKAEGGSNVIDLSIGNPDLSPCDEAIEELVRCSRDPQMHGYGHFDGQPVLKESIIAYYRERYSVTLQPQEIVVIRGVRTAMFSLVSLFAGAGDYVLFPSISYPSYYLAADFAGAETWLIDVSEEEGYLPDLSRVPEDILKKSRILILNYPNNPTGCIIDTQHLENIQDIAEHYGILIFYDNAYNEIIFDGHAPLSYLELDGAKDTGIEIFSLSKLTSLAGWRISFCAGGTEIMHQVRQFFSLTETAPFDGFQFAAAEALKHTLTNNSGKAIAQHYQKRRDILASVLNEKGIDYYFPKGSFYMWIHAPNGDGMEFSRQIFDKVRVLTVPGSYYGLAGGGSIRISLTGDDAFFAEAVKRLRSL